jgi:predicted amidophosphoribosyltransferase
VSRFLSAKVLKYRRALVGAIDTDQLCGQCGYNVRGLRWGGLCPECGSPIVLPDAAHDSLAEAPLPEIRKLRSWEKRGDP